MADIFDSLEDPVSLSDKERQDKIDRLNKKLTHKKSGWSGIFWAVFLALFIRSCVIEPYNYYDNDGVITATAEVLLQLASLELHLKEAIEKGLVQFCGNEGKMRLCLENIRLKGVKYD